MPGSVVCVSGLPVDVQLRDVVRAVEAQYPGHSVQETLGVWNKGLALMRLDAPLDLRRKEEHNNEDQKVARTRRSQEHADEDQKVALKTLKIRSGKADSMIQIADKQRIDSPPGSDVVHVRFYAIHPVRDLSGAGTDEKDLYKAVEKVWEENDGQASPELLAYLASSVSRCAGVQYRQYSAPQKVFTSQKVPPGATAKSLAPRLYAQVRVRFFDCSDASRAHLADGHILQVKGLKCVVRVENPPHFLGKPHFYKPVVNPYLASSSDEPPELLEAPLEEKASDCGCAPEPGYWAGFRAGFRAARG
eukprot:Hpha_TRINITY_DN13693_c0_g1::TRINITY_DN13693_c0_g1_i1::g.122689::m.122689